MGRQTLGHGQDFLRSGQSHVLDWERALFGMNNNEAADAVLESWHFTPSVYVPVAEQHLSGRVSEPHERVTTLLNLAAGLAAEAGYVLPGESGCWEMTPEKLQTVGLSTSLVQDSAEESRLAFEQIKESLE
jgi:hypothetical protein